jgi:hypothetical protein
MLTQEEITGFINNGYVKISNAVPRELCDAIVNRLWKDLEVDRNDSSTWTKPVMRLWYYNEQPFIKAANTPALIEAYDQLAGAGNWLPRMNMGSFPVRFPSQQDPGDTGWHVDASFPGEDYNDFSSWRVNMYCKGRALLMLFLFSDVGNEDAPTRIMIGSHKHIAGILREYGEQGSNFLELATRLRDLPHMPTDLATGAAGTVYLCHPFLVHGAQKHTGTQPKFMAQPALELKKPYTLQGAVGEMPPVEKAIVEGMLHA